MAEEPLGSAARPAYLDPFTEIVKVNFPTGANYLVLQYAVYRRMLSSAALAHITDGSEGLLQWIIDNPGGDFIVQTLISYSLARAWPVLGSTYPAPAPYDVPLASAHSGGAGKVTGTPPLPGVSGFGAGLACTFRAGDFGASGSQAVEYFPGGRFAPSVGGGFTPEFSDVPAPPSFGGRTANWAGTSAQFELYEVLSESGGAVLDALSISFGGVRVQVGLGENAVHYRAVATAAVPREEGFVRHDPAFTGPASGQNSNNRGDLWVLCERYDG